MGDSKETHICENCDLFNDIGEWDDHVSKIVGDENVDQEVKSTNQSIAAVLSGLSSALKYTPLSWLIPALQSESSPAQRSNQNCNRTTSR
jgi:hypothetical protein